MNKTSQYQFTIVVPVYNEEDNMQALEERLSAYLPTALCPTCVLFVNDGSKDRSLACIQQICARQKDFYYLDFQKNCGLSAAIKAGIDYTCSPYVGYIDADLQTTPRTSTCC
jgi:glycosyltransferase involved in cell wall biosynthesis